MEVKLKIDGREVGLNPYVTSVFHNVILALIETLKGIDEDWSIAEIEVRR